MTRNEQTYIVYDPSVGYGGTLLGALAAACDRPIHFIGTEPNSTNWLRPDRSRYDVLGELFRASVGQTYHATIEVFPVGSEVVHDVPQFQRYRGKIDLVLTSPPYFCAERYCDESTQSAIKFPTYSQWRDGFLRPTLRTCATWLRPGGYLLWNIADICVKGTFYPLEKDSIDAMLEFGLEFENKLKMTLSHPAGGISNANGMPKMKNYCTINGVLHKYEPIFVFRKPAGREEA